MGNRGIAPPILNLSAKWRWMVNITPRPLFPTPVRIVQEARWASDLVWVFGGRKISGLFRDSNLWLSNQDDVVAPAPLLRKPVPISSIEQRISWETNAYSGIDGICCLICNLKIHNRVHKNLPMDSTLSYMNTIHMFISSMGPTFLLVPFSLLWSILRMIAGDQYAYRFGSSS